MQIDTIQEKLSVSTADLNLSQEYPLYMEICKATVGVEPFKVSVAIVNNKKEKVCLNVTSSLYNYTCTDIDLKNNSGTFLGYH